MEEFGTYESLREQNCCRTKQWHNCCSQCPAPNTEPHQQLLAINNLYHKYNSIKGKYFVIGNKHIRHPIYDIHGTEGKVTPSFAEPSVEVSRAVPVIDLGFLVLTLF
jgi:hypothetical protein